MNQSIPLSYLGVEVVSNDGNPHQVQLYTDLDGEWLAQGDQVVEWEIAVGDTVTQQFSLQNQTQFGAVGGRLRYGNFIYSTKQVCNSVKSRRGPSQHILVHRIDVPDWLGWRCQTRIPIDWRFKQHSGPAIPRNSDPVAGSRIRS